MINRKKERWMTILVIVGVLLVFCMVTGGLAIELRKQLRSQIISRDG